MSVQTREEVIQALGAVVEDDPTLGQRPLKVGNNVKADAMPVRVDHVREAFAQPADVATFAHGGTRMVVFTKAVSTARGPFVLVCVADEVGNEWLVSQALRVYDRAVVVDALAADAVEAFAEVLMRFGKPFESDNRHVYWLPVFRLVPSTQKLQDLSFETVLDEILRAAGIVVAPGGPSFSMQSAFRLNDDDGDGAVESIQVQWMYLIDTAKYRADLAHYGVR